MGLAIIMILTAFLTFLLNWHKLNAATLNQTHPSYVPVCPGDTVTFTCTTTTGGVIWSLNSDGSNNRGFSYSTNIGLSTQLMPFTLTLVNKTGNTTGDTLVSTATVTDATYNLTNTSIYCTGDGMNYSNITLTVRNITSVGPPIGLSVTALNDSSVNLTWSPPSLDSIHCITGYIIITRDDGIPVVMTTTSTNTRVLSHGLSYGNTYNFTVAAVDKTNTTGSYSQHVIINLSVPNVVRNLHYTSSPGDGTITVYWDSPVNNYHPDIIRYIICYTNMTDGTSHDVTRDVTNYTLRGVSGGSTYSISVSAVNIIGEGTNDTINASLVYVSPTPTSAVDTTDVSSNTIDSTSTSASSNNVISIASSTATITSIVSTPSNNHTTPSNTQLVAAGAAVGVIFVILIIVTILILIICSSVIIIKKKKAKKSVQLDTPQQDHLMETFTGPTSPSPPQEQPTALYAQVNRNTPPVTRGGHHHHQRYNDAESTGQYSLIPSSDDNDNPPPLPPPFNPMEASEYSVLRREDKEKQRIDDMRGTNMGGPLYSTLNQERVEPAVIPAKPKGLVYAEVGNFTGRRANVPPPMEGTQSVIYSQVQQTPPIPKRTKTDQILAQIGDIEIPPPRPPKPSPRGPINNL